MQWSIYHGYGLSFVCRLTWICILVTIFSQRPHWYFFKFPNCLAINTCFCPVWLIAVIVKPSAVGVVDIVDDTCLLETELLAPFCWSPFVLPFELSLLKSPFEIPSSSNSSNDGERIVATFVYVAGIDDDDSILFVVVVSNAAATDDPGLRRPRVFDASI